MGIIGYILIGKQILQKMLRGIGPDHMSRLIMETVSEMVHIFLVSTFTVKTAAFTEFGYKVCRAGGGNYTTILQSVGCHHIMLIFWFLI